jgi:hypothetical protein
MTAKALLAAFLLGGSAPVLFGLSPAQEPAGPPVVLSPTRYDVSFDVDYAAEILRATARVELENPSGQPVREASLLLYRLMRVRGVRDGLGKDLVFRQAVLAFEERPKLQVNQVVVALPEPLAPKARTAIEFQYDGPLLGYVETGMLYVKDHIDPEFTILRMDSYCYPVPAYPSMVSLRLNVLKWKFDYSAKVTVTRGLVVANGGRLDGTDAAGDRVTFRYSSLKPSYRMDFAIAKYGVISSGSIRIYHLPADAAGAARVAEAAAKSLDLFRRWFGPAPQASALTFIEIPDGWGSQTDVTTIIQTAAAFKDPEQHRQLFHEISHLWNPPDTDLPSPRWNEGLASFLEYLVDQELTGRPTVDERAAKVLDWLRKKLPDRPELKKIPLVDYGRKDMTDFSYSVGGLFFDLLYRLGGRENFNRIIRDYVAEYGSRGGSTRDLVAMSRKDSPGVPQQLYDDWLFTTAWADRVEKSAGIEDLLAYYRSRAPKP